MKITTILGSPKKKGNTAKVLGLFEEELVNLGHDVDRVNIAGYDVKGCLGCGVCQKKTDEPGCVQKDDAVAIFEKMMSADAIVYTSPLYCWGFSSQMKALIDRHFCLITNYYGGPKYKSLIDGKRTALIVTCAGPIENNADLIQSLFDRLNSYGNCNVIGKLVVPFCTIPDEIGDEVMETAKQMAADIAGKATG